MCFPVSCMLRGIFGKDKKNMPISRYVVSKKYRYSAAYLHVLRFFLPCLSPSQAQLLACAFLHARRLAFHMRLALRTVSSVVWSCLLAATQAARLPPFFRPHSKDTTSACSQLCFSMLCVLFDAIFFRPRLQPPHAWAKSVPHAALRLAHVRKIPIFEDAINLEAIVIMPTFALEMMASMPFARQAQRSASPLAHHNTCITHKYYILI